MTSARDTGPVRVVQLSDTHLSATEGLPRPMRALLEWIAGDPPDLVVHTGDIVYEDPDLEADRRFAAEVLSELPCPLVAIPGNHDVGFFEHERLPERLAAFRSVWGDDRFSIDTDGWRLVGVDVYTVGDADADAWTRRALDTDGPLAVFVHQPVAGEPVDGWELPVDVRERCSELLDGRDVRVIASGHRHCAVARDRATATHVWAPSATLTGRRHHGGDPHPGAVEFVFEAGGAWSHRFVRADQLS